MPTLPRIPLLILTSLPIASASLIATYFYYRPLPLTIPRKITTKNTLSPSCTAKSTSRSFSIVNPCNHIAVPDSISINLLKSEIGELTDEEVLARFLKGFFGGWSFLPERTLFGALRLVGRSFIPVGFTVGIPTDSLSLSSPNDLSKTKLPEKYSKLFHGNFMALDVSIRDQGTEALSNSTSENVTTSFVDIAFGDDRRGFAGLHRLEVSRNEDAEQGGVTLCYSSVSCNPTRNVLPFPGLVFAFHRWYGMCLFRDGVEMVLRK
ncbi:hypothetical protein DL98DRAFT_463419 [Cadophora sp. DSE1049]|nr:hypothetical protein DL98DRAFT_463419 [Cadophora sp. DSE1049]